MAKNAKQQAAIAISMKKAGKKPKMETGGNIGGKKISVAKSPRPSTAGTGSAGKYVTPKKSGMLKSGGATGAFDKYKSKKK